MNVLDDFLEVLESVKDQDIKQMMGVILAKARRHTMAEAGSIFIVRRAEEDADQLIAYSLQNDRLDIETEMFTIALNKNSIAGYVGCTGEVVEIDDLYELGDDVPYHFNRSFDDKDGYRSKSMMAFPLKNYQGDVIGVVQLLNHINGVDMNGEPNYQPFPITHVDDMKSLITVLGGIVERAAMVEEIAKLKTRLAQYEGAA